MESIKAETKNHVIDIDAAQKARREKRAQALKSRRRKVKAERAEAKKARYGFIAGRRFILLCVSAAVIFFVGSSAFRIMDLKAQEEKAAEDLKAKTEQKARLESELAMLGDKEYIEEQARDRLGMVKQGEVFYVFEANGAEGDQSAAGSEQSDAEKSEEPDAASSDAGE